MNILLVRDRHGRVCITGKPTTVDADWLAMQSKPFKEGATFHSAYPLTGGAVVVDIDDVDVLRNVKHDDVIEATQGHGFNPAGETILRLWEEGNC